MKLDVFVDVTEAEDWMAVAGQIGDTFPRSNPRPFRPQIVIEDRGIDIERHFLIFSLDGASTLTSEQKEFFKTHPYLTLLANESNTGMVQCKEKVTKERMRKEESHVDVSTRVGNHSRGNGACGTSSVPERDLGHAAA